MGSNGIQTSQICSSFNEIQFQQQQQQPQQQQQQQHQQQHQQHQQQHQYMTANGGQVSNPKPHQSSK